MSPKNRFRKPLKAIREKGAAMVTVILVLMLLMAACGALILLTGLTGSKTFDAVAEKQALRAAEAGMQMTINVLRGNANGTPVSFRDAAVRTLSNKADDWMPQARLSNWLNYNYPASQPDRVTLTNDYTPYNGLAFSVTIEAPDAIPTVVPTPNPDWVDGPVIKPVPPVKPPKPAWHPWDCAHCSWDYTHCSLYNPPNNGTLRSDGTGCRHKHCIPPPNWGGVDDGYQRLILKVVGYGPKGARKELELLVKRMIFDYDAEPLIYVQGTSDSNTVSFNVAGTPEVKFDSANNIAFMATKGADVTAIQTVVDLPDKVTISGKGDDYETANSDERPKWLSNPEETQMVVNDLETDAKIRNRWFNSFPINNAGTDSAPQFTFIRGDAELKSNGAGLLVVTGKLTINNSFTFKGLILLLGEGRLDVTGGDSKIEGAIVIAKFGLGSDFSPAVLNFSAGKFEAKYNVSRIEPAMKLVNLRVQAVREQ